MEKGKGGAQEYLALQGFDHRQWRACGATNNLIASHYKDGLIGDIP